MKAPTLAFSSMTDAEIVETLRKHSIGLTAEEAKKVETMLGRPPTVVEAVIWGIQGSEHCSYKSSRRFLKMFPTDGPHVILGPREDSGIVALTDGPHGKRWGIVVSHESHNHPSQIVPFEGAATGVGGTVRDVVCMGARAVGCMDMLRLGDLKTPESRGIAKEVMRGISGYGNPLGLPNLGGDTVFDAGFNSNCLVNAIAIGIVREDEVIHSSVPVEAADEGYDIIIVGKPTDRSGFGGAAFASVVMEEEKKEQNTGAVQEPNPFLERHILASTYALFDWLAAKRMLHRISFKDLGAGGVVCASVEQVAPLGYGAEIDLGKVHVSLPDLPPEVIACAETQERFCWICHPDLTQAIVEHYNITWDLPRIAEGAGASVIGKVTKGGIYRLTYRGVVVCEAASQDITSGLQYVRPTAKNEPVRTEPIIDCKGGDLSVHLPDGKIAKTSIRDVFRRLLAHPNHASKAPCIKHYDKTVIGNSIIEAGEADASVIAPLRDMQSYTLGTAHPGWDIPAGDEKRGAVFAADGNARYGRISAYWQGANAAVESMCNVAAAGGMPRALTDCLNYGNPEIPGHLSALEEGVKGIADACRGVTLEGNPVPVISGNVSLYNSTPEGNAIPPSAIVCCIGMIEDYTKAVPMCLQRPDSVLFLLGERKDECGGSAYYEIAEDISRSPRDSLLGSRVPKPDFDDVRKQIEFLHAVARQGFLLSSHDISDGGLLLALFEMSLPQRKMGGRIGIDASIDVRCPLASDKYLFSQTPGFVLEVASSMRKGFEEAAKKHGVAICQIGMTSPESVLRVKRGTAVLLQESLSDLRTLWETGLEKVLNP